MISIIDYGMGNLSSVAKALRSQGIAVAISSDPEEIGSSKALILPGVGAFGEAMQNLQKRGLIDPVKDHIASGRPFLGICLGLQLLFEYSDESPGVDGLGVFKGCCRRFDNSLKVPHMGWNRIYKQQDTPLLDGIEDGAYVYFVHSFYVVPDEAVCATSTEYGIDFVSSIARANVYACQFHPEKSQDTGLRIIQNFGALS